MSAKESSPITTSLTARCLCPPGSHPYSTECLKPEHVGRNVTRSEWERRVSEAMDAREKRGGVMNAYVNEEHFRYAMEESVKAQGFYPPADNDPFDGHHVVLGIGPDDDVFSVAVDGDLFFSADPSFDDMVKRIEDWLDLHYPADIFTGVSGDPGSTFVVAVRLALANLKGSV